MSQLESGSTSSKGHPEGRQFTRGVKNALQITEAPEASALEFLRDLRLLTEHVDLIAPILNAIGFNIQDTQVKERFSGDVHQCTLVTDQATNRLLLRIPDVILANPSRTTRRDLLDVLTLFVRNFGDAATICIFHIMPSIHVVYKLVMNELTQREGVEIKFVQINELDDLKDLDDSQLITDSLILTLNLEAIEEVRSKPRIAEIVFSEISDLVRILSERPNFIDNVAARRILVESAGLEEVIGDFNYATSPQTVAWGMVKKFSDYGAVAERGGDHALEIFLRAILAREDLPRSHQDFVGELLERYDFSPEE